MLRFGAHAFVFVGDWTLEDGNQTLRDAARHGFDFLEIPLLDPSNFHAAAHREVLEGEGLGATVSLTLPRDAHMPAQPQRAREFLLRVMDQMALLGSSHLCGCIGYALGVQTGQPPTALERDTIVETLREVALEAEARGIRLSLEACNRYETYVYNALSDVRDAVVAVGRPNLKVHADTYHMNIEEEGFYTPLLEVGAHLDYIHMSESHRGLVGSGTVNWAEVWRGLHEISFSGALVLESFAAINPALQAATCLWRPPNQPPEVLAREGLRFLKEGAARAGLMGQEI